MRDSGHGQNDVNLSLFMMQAHIIVFGYVQGVWYRKFVKKNATQLSLSGWVRNISAGRVEGLIQGPKESIDKLIELCHVGPPFAEVKDIKIEWDPMERSGQKPEEKFEDFQIR